MDHYNLRGFRKIVLEVNYYNLRGFRKVIFEDYLRVRSGRSNKYFKALRIISIRNSVIIIQELTKKFNLTHSIFTRY